MLEALLQSDNPNATIGISSCEIVDPNREVVRALAYQHYRQPVGFLPDSEPGSFDRRNVRDGHYYLWTSLHIFVRQDAGEKPIAAPNVRLDPDGTRKNARDEVVRTLAFVMSGTELPPETSVDLLVALKQVGNVPRCAMRVNRKDDEGAPLYPYKPKDPCACAWEAAAPGLAPTGCVACAPRSTCADGSTCGRYGYCE